MSITLGSLLLLSLLNHAEASTASEPDNFCASCFESPRTVLPESGFWHNPSQPGSGFTIEVQYRKLAGSYLGFDANGAPIWYVFSGDLARAVNGEDYLWRAEVEPVELTGGTCLGCEFTPSRVSRTVGRIALEFTGRAVARYRVGRGPWIPIQPYAYGVRTIAPSAPDSGYTLPDMSGNWVMVFQDRGIQGEAASRRAHLGLIPELLSRNGSPILETLVFHAENGSESFDVGALRCTSAGTDGPVCLYKSMPGYSRFLDAAEKEFVVPVANISDSRFKGVAADGETVEGFRLDYD